MYVGEAVISFLDFVVIRKTYILDFAGLSERSPHKKELKRKVPGL